MIKIIKMRETKLFQIFITLFFESTSINLLFLPLIAIKNK
jgi:hypothetical protein